MRESALGRARSGSEGRLRLFGALVLAVFAAFGVRLFQLQVLEGETLRRRAAQNAVRTVRLEPPRGDIEDREGRVLATTRPAHQLEVVPADLRRPERVFRALGRMVGAEPAELRARVGERRGSGRFQPVPIREDLGFEELARVETHRYAMPGVGIDVRPRRHYVRGTLAAHLLGMIGEIGAEQLRRTDGRRYRAGDIVGQTGLEARLEEHLRGRAGGRNVLVDAAGREVEVLEEIDPEPGGTAVLALDLDLQRAAEAAFADVPEGEPPRRGAAVALDVETGDVLALVSRPAYDPNAFAGGIDRETWRRLRGDPWKPLQNRAVQNHYPPGSTHKPFVAAAILEEGVAGPEEEVFCPGYFRHGRRIYRCWKRGGHGDVDLHTAIQESCDVYFYTKGVELGVDRIARYAKSFGLGSPTGIRLAGEASGLVPTRAWKERRLGEIWYPGETVSASIGQGYNLYSPVQLAVAYAALANGGRVLRPRLVLRLEDREGRVVERIEPELRGRVPVAPEHLARIREALRAVVEEEGGTGGRARVPGVEVAGKTGTAQVVGLDHTTGMDEEEIPVRQRDHAWFAAFAPAGDPEIAVAVFVEHGLHGSSAAAPIAQRVLARYFEKQRPPEALPVVADSGAEESAGAGAAEGTP